MADNPKPPRTFNPLLRIIASMYILYLAFNMIRDFANVPPNQRTFFGISIVVFIVAPCWFLYTAYRDWKTIKAEEAAAAAESAALSDMSSSEEEETEDDDLDGGESALLEDGSVTEDSADETADETRS